MFGPRSWETRTTLWAATSASRSHRSRFMRLIAVRKLWKICSIGIINAYLCGGGKTAVQKIFSLCELFAWTTFSVWRPLNLVSAAFYMNVHVSRPSLHFSDPCCLFPLFSEHPLITPPHAPTLLFNLASFPCSRSRSVCCLPPFFSPSRLTSKHRRCQTRMVAEPG